MIKEWVNRQEYKHIYHKDAPAETEAAADNDEELDFGALKKKKKKKKSMAQFEADLADENADEEVVEDKSDKQAGEEAWLKSDRDYAYEEVIIIYKRVASVLNVSSAPWPCVQHPEAK